MSTLVVVKKKGAVCIAADTVTSFGSRQQRATYVAHPEKIQRVGDSYIGLVGSAAHNLVVKSIFSQAENVPSFKNRLEIFEFFRQLHTQLKKEYFLNPKEDEDDPYESSQMDMFIVNRYGMFSVYSLREVYEYQKFWAMGAGSDYAIGAMYATYEHFDSAEPIARIGVEAGIEFDDGTAGPINTYCVDLITEKSD